MEVEKAKNMGFEETELRLGLPGNIKVAGSTTEGDQVAIRKRGFSETVDLQLNLSSDEEGTTDPNGKEANKSVQKEKNLLAADPAKPPAKTQVVGWPPVRSFRKNMLAVQKSSGTDQECEKVGGGNATFVKVGMDGAPYLRKVDLKMYKTYQELSHALANIFSSFTSMGNSGMKDFINEGKSIDLLNGTEYVPTYEDKDGDWMLVGDVPWEMFVESCKRLRIMKATEATGLAPRAMEKCKNRSYK